MATAFDSSQPLRLTDLVRQQSATVSGVDWAQLSEPEARRLRELGLDEGVTITLVRHPGVLGGPAAARVGRMTIALRRHVALAIRIAPTAR